ncbi:uncharacterized protein LOC131227638 isoform X2 [Magnolia sinica]|uniref:uncharacterized protein LOC131227638 isoform X2 n=1 Tax=Magnolia sinica TaxID=86752 RepID=UPI00265A85AF|nr:uncharacterized protein LOC131227638 isoform X2 [Magnolia sinica]
MAPSSSIFLSRAITILRNSFTSISVSRATTILRNTLECLFSFVLLRDLVLCLLFLYCGLSPTTVRLDERTSVRLWAPIRPRRRKPSLVLIHGFGGNARWQWEHQIRPLSKAFNVYVPDLIFFGDSSSDGDERSIELQSRCMAEALKKVGLERYSVCGISYGGFVAYGMAMVHGEEAIEKVVILTAGICATEEEREEMKKRRKGERDIIEILMPERAEDLRALMRRSMHRPPWIPDFVLQDVIRVMYKKYRKERMEMLKELLSRKIEGDRLPVLNQAFGKKIKARDHQGRWSCSSVGEPSDGQ